MDSKTTQLASQPEGRVLGVSPAVLLQRSPDAGAASLRDMNE